MVCVLPVERRDSDRKAMCAQQRGGFLVYVLLRTHMLFEELLAWSNGDRVWCKALEIGNSKDNNGAALLSIELILTNNS